MWASTLNEELVKKALTKSSEASSPIANNISMPWGLQGLLKTCNGGQNIHNMAHGACVPESWPGNWLHLSSPQWHKAEQNPQQEVQKDRLDFLVQKINYYETSFLIPEKRQESEMCPVESLIPFWGTSDYSVTWPINGILMVSCYTYMITVPQGKAIHVSRTPFLSISLLITQFAATWQIENPNMCRLCKAAISDMSNLPVTLLQGLLIKTSTSLSIIVISVISLAIAMGGQNVAFQDPDDEHSSNGFIY